MCLPGERLLKLVMAGLLCAAGCAPATTYRRTALIPMARPITWDGRPAPTGSLRIEGAAEKTSVVRNLVPQVGDTALNVSTTMLDASAVMVIARGLELGARYAYASYAWSAETATGTMPLPSKKGVMGFGPEIRGALGFDGDQLMLGLAGNVLDYRIPTAYWALNGNCTPSPNCYDALGPTGTFGLVRYALQSEGQLNRVALNLGFFASELLPNRKYGHLFAELNIHSGFKNAGFTDQTTGPALQDAGFIPILGVGYGIELGGVRSSIMVSHAFTSTDSPVQYGWSTLVITAGGDIPLWHAAAN